MHKIAVQDLYIDVTECDESPVTVLLLGDHYFLGWKMDNRKLVGHQNVFQEYPAFSPLRPTGGSIVSSLTLQCHSNPQCNRLMVEVLNQLNKPHLSTFSCVGIEDHFFVLSFSF